MRRWPPSLIRLKSKGVSGGLVAPNRCLCGAERGSEGAAVANQQRCRTAVSGYPPRSLGRQKPVMPADRQHFAQPRGLWAMLVPRN